MNFFQTMFLEKKHVFLPKMASVTLHIPKDFWWHRIFGSATIFWVRKFWSTWSRGGGGARWSILADRLKRLTTGNWSCVTGDYTWMFVMYDVIKDVCIEYHVLILRNEICKHKNKNLYHVYFDNWSNHQIKVNCNRVKLVQITNFSETLIAVILIKYINCIFIIRL